MKIMKFLGAILALFITQQIFSMNIKIREVGKYGAKYTRQYSSKDFKTITDLKNKIAQDLEIPADQQQILGEGKKELSADTRLSDVPNNELANLLVQRIPGAGAEKAGIPVAKGTKAARTPPDIEKAKADELLKLAKEYKELQDEGTTFGHEVAQLFQEGKEKIPKELQHKIDRIELLKSKNLWRQKILNAKTIKVFDDELTKKREEANQLNEKVASRHQQGKLVPTMLLDQLHDLEAQKEFIRQNRAELEIILAAKKGGEPAGAAGAIKEEEYPISAPGGIAIHEAAVKITAPIPLKVKDKSQLYGVAEGQGPIRPKMEDEHFAQLYQGFAYFGVYDGHGGQGVANIAKKELHENIINNAKFYSKDDNAVKQAITDGFLKTDTNIKANKEFYLQGSTANVAIFKDNKIYVANAGDTRTVLSRKGKAIPLSKDHKPNRPDEKDRIQKAGGTVFNDDGIWRVVGPLGVLAMSRALGDKTYAPSVIADPEFENTPTEITDQDEFLVVACDGLWDVFSDQEAVDFVKKALSENGNNYAKVAALLKDEAINVRHSTDNVTVIIVNVQEVNQIISSGKVEATHAVAGSKSAVGAPAEPAKKIGAEVAAAAGAPADVPAAVSKALPLKVKDQSSVFGINAKQGKRPYMEDAYFAQIYQNFAYFGVYDGHRGKDVADKLAEKLHISIINNAKFYSSNSKDVEQAITVGFLTTDKEIKDNEKINKMGSTANVAIFKDGKIYVANTGDTRAVISRKDQAIALSEDHTIGKKNENKRLLYDTPQVSYEERQKFNSWNWGRAPSRAFGDADVFPFVIANPEFDGTPIDITPADQFLIIASDGLWEVFKNQQAVDFVKDALTKNSNNYEKVAQLLVDEAINVKHSTDNVTAIIVNIQEVNAIVSSGKVEGAHAIPAAGAPAASKDLPPLPPLPPAPKKKSPPLPPLPPLPPAPGKKYPPLPPLPAKKESTQSEVAEAFDNFEISVKTLSGAVYEFEITPKISTFGKLKELIAAKTGIPTGEQQITISGNETYDDASVKDVAQHLGTTFYLTRRPKTGIPKAPANQ